MLTGNMEAMWKIVDKVNERKTGMGMLLQFPMKLSMAHAILIHLERIRSYALANNNDDYFSGKIKLVKRSQRE